MAPLALLKVAQQNTHKHKSMVVESNAYTALEKENACTSSDSSNWNGDPVIGFMIGCYANKHPLWQKSTNLSEEAFPLVQASKQTKLPGTV